MIFPFVTQMSFWRINTLWQHVKLSKHDLFIYSIMSGKADKAGRFFSVFRWFILTDRSSLEAGFRSRHAARNTDSGTGFKQMPYTKTYKFLRWIGCSRCHKYLFLTVYKKVILNQKIAVFLFSLNIYLKKMHLFDRSTIFWITLALQCNLLWHLHCVSGRKTETDWF